MFIKEADKPQIKFTYARRKQPKALSVDVSSLATLFVNGSGGGVELRAEK